VLRGLIKPSGKDFLGTIGESRGTQARTNPEKEKIIPEDDPIHHISYRLYIGFMVPGLSRHI
jgi:hypothetical protein